MDIRRMSPAEELDLVQRAQVGNYEALEQLITACDGLIAAIVGGLHCDSLIWEDLAQIGRIAIFHCVRLYDPSRGARFSTFARSQARWRMIEGLRQWLHLPQSVSKKWPTVRKAAHRLTSELPRVVTAQDIAGEAGVPLSIVQEVLATLYGREIPLPEDEANIESIQHQPQGPPLATKAPSPLDTIISEEDFVHAVGDVAACLNYADFCKWLVLSILREDDAYKCEWVDIADLLSHANPDIHPPWSETLCGAYPHLDMLPRSWMDVQRLFQTAHPTLTSGGLRKWYSRLNQRMEKAWRQAH